MELELKRIAKREDYTIGRLYVDGSYFCDTLEDKCRGLKQTDLLSTIKEKKVKGKTAIPAGRYKITLDIYSPRFGGRSAYKFCGGRLPRLWAVPGFEGILIHGGNSAKDTEGCILVGENKEVGRVVNSLATLRRLYERMKGESEIWITIK